MRLKALLLCSLVITFLSCKSTEERLNSGIKEYLENVAFKENQTLTIFDLKTVRYEELSQGAVDSLLSLNFKQRLGEYGKLYTEQLALAQERINDSDRAAPVDRSIAKKYLDMAEEHTKQARVYRDSCEMLHQKDSILNLKIVKDKASPVKYFKATTYLKATVGKENVLDTLGFVLSKDYRVIPLR